MRISKMRALALLLAMAGTWGASPALAAAPKAKAQAPAVAKDKLQPDFNAIIGLFDKLFPPQPDPDPSRLALARTSVGAMWPDGAYGKMMTGFMGSVVDRVMQLKTSDLATLDPKAAKTNASAGADDLSLHDQAVAKDPYFDRRMAAMRDAVGEEIGKVSLVIDPRVRDGLARSMARRFDTQQLTDINAFFATPSGRALASQYLQLWLDPDTLRSMMGTLPEMMKLMPDMMQKIEAASDKFPNPPKPPSKDSKR